MNDPANILGIRVLLWILTIASCLGLMILLVTSEGVIPDLISPLPVQFFLAVVLSCGVLLQLKLGRNLKRRARPALSVARLHLIASPLIGFAISASLTVGVQRLFNSIGCGSFGDYSNCITFEPVAPATSALIYVAFALAAFRYIQRTDKTYY